MASLLIVKGTHQGQRFPLDRDRLVLGRDPACDVVIAGTAVSRRHAIISRVGDKYYIEDGDGTGVKSRNGTRVNEDEVPFPARVQLKNNDLVKICDVVCSFEEGVHAKPLPPELRPEEPEPPDESEMTSSVEAVVSHLSTSQLLDTQPAEKLKAILEISSSLSKTLELDPLLPKIIDSLFQLFKQADRGFIILLDEGTQRLIPKVIKTRRPQDEANARFSRSIVKQCLESVQALLSDDATSDKRFTTSQSIADFSIRSVMLAPLWTQEGTAFGVIQLDTQDRRKKFTQDDLNLLVGIASQASIALVNARLHQDLLGRERLKRDLELARQVQRSFLPVRFPAVPGYEFHAYYESALEVSGDYYDFIPLPQQRWGIMLGDVAGKGVAAALLMAKFSAEARFCMLTEPDPAAAVTRLNAMMHESGLTDRFVTLAGVLLDPNTHTATLVNAGHPSPLILRHASNTLEEAAPKEAAGLPVGVLEGYQYTSLQAQLQPGDSLLMFSDGVTDAMDVQGSQFQIEGIHAALKEGKLSPRGVVERIVKAVKDYAAGRSQHDDITLVSFGRTVSR